jgi:hypothetical protein
MSLGQLHETKKTTPTQAEFFSGIITAWFKLFKTIPNKDIVCIIYAKFGLETGYGQSAYNYNFGNIKKFPNDSHTSGYMFLKNVWEIENGKKVVYQPPHPQCMFRSYDSIEDGLKGYLELISSKHYEKAWNALLTGNPTKYVTALKAANYFTGDLTTYINSVNSIYSGAMKKDVYEKALIEFNKNQLAELNSKENEVKEPEVKEAASIEPVVIKAEELTSDNLESIKPPAEEKPVEANLVNVKQDSFNIFEVILMIIRAILSLFKK